LGLSFCQGLLLLLNSRSIMLGFSLPDGLSF